MVLDIQYPNTPATVRAVITYTVNRAGMRRTETSTIDGGPGNGTASFAYDSAGRLTGYDSPLGSTSDRDYTWDEVVSRTGVTSDPSGTPATVTTSFGAADRPTSDTAGGSYTHDADGRMTARPGQTLEWDSLGRLRKVRDGSTNAVISEYTYDALDRLREVTSGGSTTRMRYVGLTTTIGTTWDTGTSTTTRSYATHWDGSTHASFTSTAGSQRSYGTNGHGDVTWLAGDTGAVTRTYRYDPWGTIIASSGGGHTPHIRFQSSWRDGAVELYWVVTRWYAPVQARFISEDSLLGQPINPDSRHRYAYAEGDPIDGWDPDGRSRYGGQVYDWGGFRVNESEFKYCGNPLHAWSCARVFQLSLEASQEAQRLFPMAGYARTRSATASGRPA